jgi:hypothetical protein
VFVSAFSRVKSAPGTRRGFVATHSVDRTASPLTEESLAMHCYEHIRLSEIAACIGVTESLVCQIHVQIVALLRNYLWRVSKPVSGVVHKSRI